MSRRGDADDPVPRSERLGLRSKQGDTGAVGAAAGQRIEHAQDDAARGGAGITRLVPECDNAAHFGSPSLKNLMDLALILLAPTADVANNLADKDQAVPRLWKGTIRA
jgi:hypothetical protein